jgi:hypothetical protein
MLGHCLKEQQHLIGIGQPILFEFGPFAHPPQTCLYRKIIVIFLYLAF